MKAIKIGKNKFTHDGPFYFIAELGQNHQGELDVAMKMIEVAADCGVHAVKLQKRDNKSLFTKFQYEKDYDNENSFGKTYGEHREALEFGEKEYKILKQFAEDRGVDFLCTAWDEPSADFLEKLGMPAYKIASSDITNIPLLTYVAKFGKPMIVSTGACSLDEVKRAYEAIVKYNDQIALLHCTAGYPTDYPDLNLKAIETLKREFPEAIVGYSGHDNGILASIIAHMLGAVVFEKHFTLNRSMKGGDHKFSLEPEGLRKQIRDLERVAKSLGDGIKELKEFEIGPKTKMGKSLYASKPLKKGTILKKSDIAIKVPAGNLPPYELENVLGKELKVDLTEEAPILFDHLKDVKKK